MLIGKNYKVEVQGLDLVLFEKCEKTSRKTKEVFEGWKPLGFFSSFEGVVNHLKNKHVRESDLTDVKTVMAAINDLKAIVRAIPQAPVIINKDD